MKGIIKSIFIYRSHLFVDGNLVLKAENPIFGKFLKEIYNFLEIKYPKYFKMDALSKLGFMASEVLLKDQSISENKEKIGIVLGNSSSTFIVDSLHQESINDKENYFPSPANFVYTLPNVMTGEICIRNGFKGENAIFVTKQFDVDFITKYLKMIYKAHKAEMMIGGFVNADEDDYEAFMFLTDKESSEESMDSGEIEEFYSNLKLQIQNLD